MKKKLTSIVFLMLVLNLITGCSGNQKSATVEKTNLILATGGTSGTYYPLGGAMAQIWNTKSNGVLNVTAQSTGAAMENIRLIDKEDVELAIVQSDTTDYAYKGTELFKEKLSNIRVISYLYPEIIQLVARADSNINSMHDLKGKIVGVGAPGSGTEAAFRQIMEVYGLTYDDINEQFLSFSECAYRFKEKEIDAFLVVAGLPNSAILDISRQSEIKVINLTDDMIMKINHKFPFFTKAIIPANTYNGQTADVKSVAVMATLVTNAKTPDDIVYSITKIMFENMSALAQAHPKGKEIKLEYAAKSITVPFHPGAQQYFKEKGVLK